MSTLYRIRDWDKHYENAESRKCKNLTWLKLPVKLNGNGYSAMMEIENGPALFGCFIALVELAVGSVERGSFMDSSGRPLTTRAIARLLRMPHSLVEQTLNTLSSGEFDWIEAMPLTSSAGKPVEQSPTTPGNQSSVLGKQSPQIREDQRRVEQMRAEENSGRSGSQVQPSAREASPPATPTPPATLADDFAEDLGASLGRKLAGGPRA